jgi:response regulator RpfG family c-di-GMP phosphodiesterase
VSRILVVEDSESVANAIALQLKKIGHEAALAPNGDIAIGKLVRFIPDLILLDIMLPGMNGFGVLKEIRSYENFRTVPVIMMSSAGSKESVINAFRSGANDFLVKPFDMGVFLGKITGWLNSAMEKHWNNLDHTVTHALRLTKATMEESFEAARKSAPLPVENIMGACGALYDTVEAVGSAAVLKAVEDYNSTLFLHSLLVGIYMMLFARFRCFGKDDAVLIAAGGLLHDIGSVAIPANIMFKPDKLDPEEFELVKQHVAYGVSIMDKTPELSQMITGMCRCHHERMDGKGYPAGLLMDDIPVEARLTAIVEVYAALTTKTVYRAALDKRDVFKEMKSSEGHLDMKLLSDFEGAVMAGFKPVDMQ